MKNRHLLAQLARFFPGGVIDPQQIPLFLEEVDATYDEFDLQSQRLIRSIELTSNELLERNTELRGRHARLERLNSLIVTLARSLTIDSRPELARLTEACALALGVSRASVWRVESDRLTCLDLYEHATGSHSAGATIATAMLPRYSTAISSARTVAAHDARHDPRTAEMTPDYLTPLGITSMLDAGVFIRGSIYAVLCFEHQGPKRTWHDEEVAFAGSIADLIAISVETTRRREAEAELDRQRTFLRQVIDLIPSLVFAKDREGRFVLVNDATASMYGCTVADLLGKRDADFNSNAEEVAQFLAIDRQVLTTLKEHVVDAERITDAAGQERWLQTVKRPILEPDGRANAVLGVAIDITKLRRAETERQRLEANLRQAQKIESLGLLAGGIAHDLNNILTPVLLTASIALETTTDPEMLDNMNSILASAEAARDLTTRLLAFGRKQVLALTSIDLHEVIRTTIGLISRLVPAHTRLVFRPSSRPAVTRIDQAQMQQVLINLIMNACDAMPRGGIVTISTDDGSPDQVTLIVSDTGEGIPEEILAQIFDPFFTTKELGRGTGLGLATVQGIVQQHEGTISVRSGVGVGTRFEIRLPRRARTSAPIAIPRPGASPRSTILLVEDESPIRRLVDRILSGAGHTLLIAEHAEEAIAIAARVPSIDLLLTDVVLPGLSGPDLYKHLQPAINRVVYMSGHARDAFDDSAVPTGAAFLRKPFTVADLTAIVGTALARVPQLAHRD